MENRLVTDELLYEKEEQEKILIRKDKARKQIKQAIVKRHREKKNKLIQSLKKAKKKAELMKAIAAKRA